MDPALWQAKMLTCAAALAGPGQPHTLYGAIEHAFATLVGHRLFTMMVLDRDGNRVRRVYSNRPADYPVGGFKTHRETPWGRLVLAGGTPYIGRNADDIRWAYPDHERLASMGCTASLNLPVRHDGQVIGTINLLDATDHYVDDHARQMAPFAALVVPAFHAEIAA